MAAIFLQTVQTSQLNFSERLGVSTSGYLFVSSGISASSETDDTLVTVSGRLWAGDVGLEINGDNSAVRVFEGGSIRSFGVNTPLGGSAVVFGGENGDLINKGLISALDGIAVIFRADGGGIKNYGVIEAPQVAIQALDGITSIDNAGVISGANFSLLATNLSSSFLMRQFGDGYITGDVLLINDPAAGRLGHVIIGGVTQGDITVEFDFLGGRDVYDVGMASEGGSTVFAYAGNDLIRGADIAYGGDGKDTLIGVDSLGTSRGTMAYGEDGDDKITGYIEAYGGDGNDTLIGAGGINSGLSTLGDGGSGNDVISGFVMANGGEGNDILTAAAEVSGFGRNLSRLSGGSGDDILNGADKRDFLIGGSGDDQLFGNVNIDTLRGGEGDDILDGGADDDFAILEGVQGDYSFTLESDGSVTVIDLNLADGDEGTDTLIDIEFIRFEDNDGTLSDPVELGDLI